MAMCCNSKDNQSSNCCSGSASTLVLSCSGGSNVGQIANTAAIELDKQGKARMYCLVGVAAHIGGMVDSAKSAGGIIVLDGCPVACARVALEHLGIPYSQHIVVTDLGMEKNHEFKWTDAQVDTVISAVSNPVH